LDEYETFAELVAQGAIFLFGMDEDGEPLYAFNMERLKEVHPDLYWHEKNAIDAAVLEAVDLGFLTMDIDPENMEVTLNVTEAGDAMLNEEDNSL